MLAWNITLTLNSVFSIIFSPELRTEHSVNDGVEGGVEIAQPQEEAERKMSWMDMEVCELVDPQKMVYFL